MTPAQLSAVVTAGAISAFLIIGAFNLGRLTNGTVHLRSACDLSEEEREDLKANWYMSNMYVEPDRR